MYLDKTFGIFANSQKKKGLFFIKMIAEKKTSIFALHYDNIGMVCLPKTVNPRKNILEKHTK